VLIVDGHLDLAMNALRMNRDLLQSVYTIRTQEKTIPGKGRALGTVALPEMRRGRIALCFATLVGRIPGREIWGRDFAFHTQSYAMARANLAYYDALSRLGQLELIKDARALTSLMRRWDEWESRSGDNTPPPVGAVICMEGADPVQSPRHLQEWWDGGLRMLGLTHYGSGRYAGGTGTELPLHEEGAELLAEARRLGVLLDLTHLSDPAFWEVLDRFDGPVLASHNTCRALVPIQRALSDDQLRALIERGGVVGVAFDAWMLQAGYIEGSSTNALVSLATVVDHIDHVCQVAGDARHVALGTDLDGGYGREQSPHDLDTIADLQNVAGLLEARGYPAEQVRDVFRDNWTRFLLRSWGAS
jgi:membrane dipeptidase